MDVYYFTEMPYAEFPESEPPCGRLSSSAVK